MLWVLYYSDSVHLSNFCFNFGVIYTFHAPHTLQTKGFCSLSSLYLMIQCSLQFKQFTFYILSCINSNKVFITYTSLICHLLYAFMYFSLMTKTVDDVLHIHCLTSTIFGLLRLILDVVNLLKHRPTWCPGNHRCLDTPLQVWQSSEHFFDSSIESLNKVNMEA